MLKNKCITCKKYLIVPSWKTCQECDPRNMKKSKPVVINAGINFNEAYEDITFKCNKKKALDSDTLMYDDITLEIVGYRKPRYKLKE